MQRTFHPIASARMSRRLASPDTRIGNKKNSQTAAAYCPDGGMGSNKKGWWDLEALKVMRKFRVLGNRFVASIFRRIFSRCWIVMWEDGEQQEGTG
jgi:hypothetical protein